MSAREQILKQNFEKLFKEFFIPLCYFAQKYLGDLDTCKEVVHNVFIKIWENREQFDWEKPAKSYLFTSVYNRSINHIRDNKKFDHSDTEVLDNADSGEYADKMETAELESKIKNALLKLPEKCREIFELSRFEGKKYAEIASLLNISVKTVETQMSKALKILKEELKDYLYIILVYLLFNMNKY